MGAFNWINKVKYLTLLHSEWPKLYGALAILSATGLKKREKMKLVAFNWIKRVKYSTLLHSEWPKLYGVLAILSAIGLKKEKMKLYRHIIWRVSLSSGGTYKHTKRLLYQICLQNKIYSYSQLSISQTMISQSILLSSCIRGCSLNIFSIFTFISSHLTHSLISQIKFSGTRKFTYFEISVV